MVSNNFGLKECNFEERSESRNRERRRARDVNFAVDVEIALEIEKVKYGHGKRETGEASGRDFLCRWSARKKRVKFAGGHIRATYTYTDVYLRSRRRRRRDGDQVTAFPCYRSTAATVIYLM